MDQQTLKTLQQQAGVQAKQLEEAITQRVTQNVLSVIQKNATAIEVLKKRLGVTEEEFQKEILTYENEVFGLQECDRPAKKGDTVRILVTSEVEGKLLPETETLLFVNKLYTKGGVQKVYETNKDLEKAVVGLSTGDTGVVEIKEGKTFKIHYKLLQVAEKKEV